MSIDPIGFIRQHGVVLESSQGPVPNLAEAVAGTTIRGSWWSHRDGKKIFQATRLTRDNEDILVCRLVEGRVTYVDRRLWPALVRLAGYFEREALEAIREKHSSSGAHIIEKVPFPKWVPPTASKSAKALSEKEAAAQLGPWAIAILQSRRPRSRPVKGKK